MSDPDREKLSTSEPISPELTGGRQVGIGELTMADDAWWLELLREAAVTPEELAWGNQLAVTGSVHLSTLSDPTAGQAVLEARKTFFGSFLRFDEEDHEVFNSYQKVQRTNDKFMPCYTLIETQRLFYGKGIDGKQIVAARRNLLTRTAPTVGELVGVFEKLGKDPAKLFKTMPSLADLSPDLVRELNASFTDADLSLADLSDQNPRILSIDPRKYSISSRIEAFKRGCIEEPDDFIRKYPQALLLEPPTIDYRFERMYQVSSLLGWLGSLRELVNAYPTYTILASETRREAYAHLFLRHGQRQWTAKTIGSLLSEPLECHLLALALGYPYESRSIHLMDRQFTGEKERKSIVSGLLSDQSPEAKQGRSRIGGSVIRAYQLHANKKQPAEKSSV